jgi:hypothetical protein
LKATAEKPYISLALRVYGSEVYYSQLDNIDNLKKLGIFLKETPKDRLYKAVDVIKNFHLFDMRVRQPLRNGLEFNTFFDTSFAVYVKKESQKTENPKNYTFDIKNFYR